jgi:hypothetical protein
MTRLDKLRQLGLSEDMLRLAVGDPPHQLFDFECVEPYEILPEHGGRPPDPDRFIPLWQDSSGLVIGCWEKAGRVEFIRFSLEWPDEYDVVAYSEQGLLARIFADIVQYVDWNDEAATVELLREAAKTVGFAHLDEVLRFQEHLTEYRDVNEFTRSITNEHSVNLAFDCADRRRGR